MDFCKNCYTPIEDGEEYCNKCINDGSMKKDIKKREKEEKKRNKKPDIQKKPIIKQKPQKKTKKPQKKIQKPSQNEIRQLFIMGVNSAQRGDFKNAIKYWETYAEYDPDEFAVWTNLAKVYRQLENNNKAAENLKKALKLEKSHSLEWENLGTVLLAQVADEHSEGKPFNQKLFDEAIDCYHKSLSYDKNNFKVYIYMGIAYLNTRDLNKAKECVDKYLELDPNNSGAQKFRKEIEEQINSISLEKESNKEVEETHIIKTYVGQKVFVNNQVGIDTTKQIYAVMHDIIKFNMDWNKIIMEMPYYAAIRNQDTFEIFIYEVLNDLINRQKLKGKDWKKIDPSTIISQKIIREINEKIWENIDNDGYDKEKFMNELIRLKDDFIYAQSPDLQENYLKLYSSLITNIDEYYGLIVGMFLSRNYGIANYGYLSTYLSSPDYVKLSDIPLEIQNNSSNLETQVINGEQCLKGSYIFGTEFSDNHDYNLKLIKLEDFANIKQVFGLKNLIIGYPFKDTGGIPIPPFAYEIYPIIITDFNSKRLYSRLSFKEGKVIDKGKMWWNNKTVQIPNYLERDDGVKYGIEVINFLITRFGNTYRVVRSKTQLYSLELKQKQTSY